MSDPWQSSDLDPRIAAARAGLCAAAVRAWRDVFQRLTDADRDDARQDALAEAIEICAVDQTLNGYLLVERVKERLISKWRRERRGQRVVVGQDENGSDEYGDRFVGGDADLAAADNLSGTRDASSIEDRIDMERAARREPALVTSTATPPSRAPLARVDSSGQDERPDDATIRERGKASKRAGQRLRRRQDGDDARDADPLRRFEAETGIKLGDADHFWSGTWRLCCDETRPPDQRHYYEGRNPPTFDPRIAGALLDFHLSRKNGWANRPSAARHWRRIMGPNRPIPAHSTEERRRRCLAAADRLGEVLADPEIRRRLERDFGPEAHSDLFAWEARLRSVAGAKGWPALARGGKQAAGAARRQIMSVLSPLGLTARNVRDLLVWSRLESDPRGRLTRTLERGAAPSRRHRQA